MAYRVNPQTGQLEDDNGNPVGAAPLDQMAPAAPGPAPGMLAANQRAGRDLSMPVVLDRGGNDLPPMGLPPQAIPEAPAAGAPQQPPPMVRDTNSYSRTREVPLPQERAAMKRVTAADEEAARLAGQQGNVLKDKAAADALAARQRVTERATQTQEIGATLDQGHGDVAKAKSLYESENAKLAAMGGPKDFWETRSTGQKIAAAIALVMGGIGGVLNGKGGNTAMDVISKAADDDYRLQMAKIQHQEKRVAEARGDIGLARQQAADARGDLDILQAARWNQIGAYAEQKAAQIGTQNAGVQAQIIKNAAEGRTADHLQNWYAGMRDKVTQGGTSSQGTGTAPGEGAGRAAGIQIQKAQLAEHGAAALATMDKMLAAGYRPNQADIERMQNNEKEMATAAHAGVFGATVGRATGILARSRYQGMTPQAQQFFQASDILAQKAAAIASPSHAADEIEHVRQMFSLNPGDTPQIMQQKLDQARGVIGAAKALGGKFTGQAAAGAEAERRAAPPPGIMGGGPDQAKVQMARQRLQANPNDTVARDWLAAHGL